MPPYLHDSVRSLSDGQAQYILDRLVADGRITRADIAHYANDIHREIAEIEQRLATLRSAAGERHPVASPAAERQAPQKAQRTRRRRGNRLAGSYMGYMRQVSPADKPRYQALKQEKGYEAAIAAMKADLGK